MDEQEKSIVDSNSAVNELDSSSVVTATEPLQTAAGPTLVESKSEQSFIGVNHKSKSSSIKKYFLYIMVAGLILSALISIIAVLFGEFNEFIQRSLLTTVMIVVHSLIALAFVSASVEKSNRADEVIVDTIFGIIVASFVTSILSIWDILNGPIVSDLYLLYIYAAIAAVMCRALLQVNRDDSKIRLLADASIGATIFLFLLLMPSIFVNDAAVLPDIYYRGLGAAAILLGTMSVLTAILYKLYLNKHPELQALNHPKQQSSSVLKVVVIILLILLLLPFFLWLLIFLMWR